MAAEKWVAGSLQGLAWGSAGFSTEINSLANGNAVLAANQIDNSTALDVFADVSVVLGSISTGSGAPYLGLYLYPLNGDDTSFGDGRFASAAAGPPPSGYFAGIVPLPASATATLKGTLRGIVLPPGAFKFVIYNQAGASLAGSGNAIDLRTYNRAVG